ncbi:hypothetical protein SLU01_07680 [Sporosarcina luteola]|uniref:Uncharacterized protein n=1 Tax=Sporosarcina luteola TaxID=582850 RepID=A0A511Z4T8_9BACL|nr:competence protein ComK [Sporosarcina luteola]GEN82456.1 hypothetical protein SLU01_07680 [Sporosarcina luteola]
MFSKSFLLDHRALALRWANGDDGLSEILTTHGNFLSNRNPMELLDQASIWNHTIRSGSHMKPDPSCLNQQNYGFFQTAESRDVNCVWIFNRFFTSRAVGMNKTELRFENGSTISVHASKSFIDQQRKRLHRADKPICQLNYILPGSKEFNYHYYSIEHQ